MSEHEVAGTWTLLLPRFWRLIVSAFGLGLNAYQPEPHSGYAVEDAVEVGPVDNLPREDRVPALGFYLHLLKGRRVSLAELSTDNDLVDSSCAHEGSLFVSILLIPPRG